MRNGYYKRCISLWYVCLIVLVVDKISSHSLNDTDTLRRHLLEDYNADSRGNLDQTTPSNITCHFSLSNINGFDEVSGEFAVVGFFSFFWTDERMVWNPKLYNGISEITLRQANVWTPSILVGNSYGDSDVKTLGEDFMLVRYTENGSAFWSPGAQYKSYCRPDITDFPYDTQECYVEFVPWGYTGKEISFTLLSNKISLDLYLENGIWNLSDTSMTAMAVPSLNDLQVLTLKFTLQRRPSFYLVNMILPIGVMGVLNLLVFFLPPESSDRVGYSITLLLAICVYLTIASDNLPKTSFPSVSLLCIKLLVDMVISSFVVVFSIIGPRVYYADTDTSVPPCLKAVTRAFLCISSKRRKSRLYSGTDLQTVQGNGASGQNMDDKSPVAVQEHRDLHEADDISWQEVGRATDRIFFFLTLILFAISHITYTIYVNSI